MPARTAAIQVVVGTAGHVDHGKSSLVIALTGTDPDRLPEEKRRGMTIELGFAFLRGPAGLDLAFIDCPGHERFVHHMVAGAGSMDGCLLIIAADEGPCAQTREHLEILRLLDLRWGRVVLTKSDLVDPAGLAAAAELALDLVRGTPFAAEAPIAVSARSGAGLPELRSWLLDRAAECRRQTAGVHPRLPVDRVFSLAGHGTVVTGTLLSGELSPGAEIELFPGGPARIRSLQVNHQPVDRALAGQRTAINLTGIERDAIPRGAWLATPGSLQPTTTVDVRLEVLPTGVRHRIAIEAYHGATHATGRLHLLHLDEAVSGEHEAQLRLDAPLWLRPGDRLVLRRPSPPANLAGAIVVDTAPPHHARFSQEARDWFAARSGRSVEALAAWLTGCPSPPTRADAEGWAGGPAPLAAVLAAAGPACLWRTVGAADRLWLASEHQRLGEALLTWLERRTAAEPERIWHGQEDARQALAPRLPEPVWIDLLDSLAGPTLLRHDGRLAAPGRLPPPPPALAAAARRLLAMYQAAGLEPPYEQAACEAEPDPALAARAQRWLAGRGWLIRVNARTFVHRQQAETLIATVHALLATAPLTLPIARDRLGLSRRRLVECLDWLDAIGVTRRQGDVRLAGPHPSIGQPLIGDPP